MPRSAGAGTIKFADVTETSGLRKPLAGIMGHGAAWGDFDGDGRIDLYVGGFCDRPDQAYTPADAPVPNRLFRNLGDGRFERVRQPAVEFFGRTSGAVFVDLDNDGAPELYVANNARPHKAGSAEPQRSARLRLCDLFHNDGGKLVPVSRTSGACPAALESARNIGVFDYDGDGLLDLLVVEDRFTQNPRSVLLRNRGRLRFEDVTRAAGLPDDLYGLGLAVADLNRDGRPDFFIGHSNRMFLSTAAGTYQESEALKKVFAWEPLGREDWPCGAAFADLNRDGRLDMVLGVHSERARNRVYINEGLVNGVPRFRDVTSLVGFPEEVPNKSPHVEIQDFDNDGWPDIYFSTAWLDEQGNVTPLVFRNTGAVAGLPHFEPPRPIRGPMVYYSTGPSGDYDRDGRIDLFLVNWFRGNHCRLLHNESPKRHWLDVQVVGRRINRMGIGCRVSVYATGRLGRAEDLLGCREIAIGYGYAAGQEAACHFGLGDRKNVDVEVKLPDGRIIRRTSVAADQRVVIRPR